MGDKQFWEWNRQRQELLDDLEPNKTYDVLLCDRHAIFPIRMVFIGEKRIGKDVKGYQFAWNGEVRFISNQSIKAIAPKGSPASKQIRETVPFVPMGAGSMALVPAEWQA